MQVQIMQLGLRLVGFSVSIAILIININQHNGGPKLQACLRPHSALICLSGEEVKKEKCHLRAIRTVAVSAAICRFPTPLSCHPVSHFHSNTRLCAASNITAQFLCCTICEYQEKLR